MNRKERQFIETVWRHYKKHGRYDLPWRQKAHLKPYNILVSEMMLQQTQVERVVPKYLAFIKQWGGARLLSSAPLGEVLKAWQGLGYNSRAKYLHTAANTVVNDRGGRFPRHYDTLRALPGVGPYTAGAVVVFAYNQPVPLIETNIRTAYLHHFFADRSDVSDKEILRLITITLDRENPREWYWALMDYGAHLKRTHGNNVTMSRHYKKQSHFKGSDREIRGAIMRELTGRPASREKLHKQLSLFDTLRLDAQLERLLQEGMLQKQGRQYRLPG